MKQPLSIKSRLRRLVATISIMIVAILASVLVLLMVSNSHYARLLHNVTTASEFNQEFKNNIDQKMYYYVIESQYSEGLPMEEVAAAQELAKDLLNTTTQKDSLQAITSVLDLCENLEDKLLQIEQTSGYDERQNQLENNVYVLTSLVEEYMYTYLYYEAAQLNAVQQQMGAQIVMETVLVVIVTLGVIIFGLSSSLRLSRSITDPLMELCTRAEGVTGGELTHWEPLASDAYEIRTLSETMGQMLERLDAQMQETQQKQETLRRTELALLQAQINPHFLYNTMDTIVWLIEAEKSQEAVDMVANLSAFFRHSLSRGEDVITLEEEEHHVRSYLQIQQVRYKDVMSYEVEIDPALRGAVLPKLTLQPLVENALYHGVKLKRSGGVIRITGRREGDNVLLTVEDNGVGMTAERLAGLRRSIETQERVGFGVSAVNQRLQLLFGPGYGLSIDSREGEGCRVEIRMPLREKGEVEG